MITVTDLDEVSENQNSDYLEVTYQQVEGKHWVYDKKPPTRTAPAESYSRLKIKKYFATTLN